jgi:hypothetical protein
VLQFSIKAYDREAGGNVRTLGLRVALLDPGRPSYPVVTIHIDGEDVLGKLPGGFIGFDPEEILDSGALLPTDPPLRVAVYRCSCGEAGCGCVAPVIELTGGHIRWSDFRDSTGVYARPLDDPAPTGGSAHGLANLEFGAAQYRREVERASLDRSWETNERRTARLLRKALSQIDAQFTDVGYWRGWVTGKVTAGGNDTVALPSH